MTDAPAFSPRAALGVVLAGTLAFVVLLYAIGAGLTSGRGNDGGGHALSKGLTGFAGLADLLGRTGFEVRRSRDAAALDDRAVLVLTPPHEADGEDIRRIVEAHRQAGPTVLVLPKWIVAPARGAKAKTGWSQTLGTQRPQWLAAVDDRLGSGIGKVGAAAWRDDARTTALPAASAGQWLTAKDDAILPLVTGADDRILAGYRNDDGDYPALDRWSGWEPPVRPDTSLFPLVIVAEPDLLDNRGLADRAAALKALALFRAIHGNAGNMPVIFDVTLNGLGRTRNLLTLAFTPPFVAATIALLLAAIAAGWRAFLRFGPARLATRPIAFGKTALVENSAGLIRRAGRIHLLGAPYAALVASRVKRQLGLASGSDVAAIDAAQARRGIAGGRFSSHATALAAARKPHDLVRHAAALHAIERALTR